MSTFYIKPTGMSQADLVNCLKDIETALGGTNSTPSITITTTPVRSYALSAATSAAAFTTSKVDTMGSVFTSVVTAGGRLTSGVSAAVSAGYTGGLVSALSVISSRLTSGSIV